MQKKELVKLVAGFNRFRQKYFDGEDSIYRKLSLSGQTPKTLIIGCCDSRVDPAILSSANPGDLFVIRNVANLVPPFENKGGLHGVSSAIEFAVVNLKVENIIVLGHRQCGGIRSLMTGMENPQPSFIASWMSIAEDAKKNVLLKFPNSDIEIQCGHCELESLRISINNLRTFPFVQQAIKERDLNLIGAYFDIEQGQLLELNESTGEFAVISNSN
jgi:carbonic anhydrase